VGSSFEKEKSGATYFVFDGTVNPEKPPEGGWPYKQQVDPRFKDHYGPEEIVWGVRCNPLSFEEDQKILESNPSRFHIEFKTRWGPPILWAHNVVSQQAYADLRLQLAYCEAGMGFYGSLILRGTEIIERVQGQIENGLIYPEDSEEEDTEATKCAKIEKSDEAEDSEEEDEIRVNWDTPFGSFVKRWRFESFGG
jgi:hypothetical protein